MAAAPDDDARRTLAELEAKLRELERELLRGYEPEGVEADPFAAPAEAAEDYPPEPVVFPAEEAEPEPTAPAEPEPPAPPVFDAAEWAIPETREHAAPQPPDEAETSFEADLESAREPEGAEEPAYEGGLADEPLPTFEPAPVDEAEPLAPDEPPAVEADAAPPYPAAPQPPDAPALAPEPEPEPEPEPVARLDHDALDAAHGMLAALRDTVEDMGLTAARVTAEARAVADDHGRTLGRVARVAQAAARAEQAAHEAGRLAATVVVEAGPFANAGAVTALRDALASQPGARDAYVRGVEDGRAVIEVHLAPPST
jgi:hypothetical protein